MAPKQISAGASRGGRGRGGSTAARPSNKDLSSRSRSHAVQPPTQGANSGEESDPFASENDAPRQRRGNNDDVEGNEAQDEEDEDEEEEQKTIPPELLTRILHEFFEKDGTRISKDANKAVAKYVDIFVRESIARTAREKEKGFLEVEDLEKIAPQLLMDL
ncbi:CENP-S associating centromere protein X-domain-containing protein [Xylariaceae sp. FL0255]|nr:CENP-S associating centromere protein X-domain-containing protein [Xylariaceae sp. FL0255]